MAKEIVIDKIPEEFTHKKLGESCSGECYETKDGRVFKKYKFPIKYYQSLKSIADFYKCNHLVLPEEFYFLKNMKEENFIGYIRALVTGTTFAHLEDNVEMVKFIRALEFLEREMVANSRRSLLYVDMNEDNLFLTPNNEIKVIDQDLYEIIGYHPYIRPVPDSMKDLASTIIHVFFTGKEFTDSRIHDNIRKCGAHIGGVLRPSQLLSETSEILEQDCGTSIRTLGDFRKGLKLVKEK